MKKSTSTEYTFTEQFATVHGDHQITLVESKEENSLELTITGPPSSENRTLFHTTDTQFVIQLKEFLNGLKYEVPWSQLKKEEEVEKVAGGTGEAFPSL